MKFMAAPSNSPRLHPIALSIGSSSDAEELLESDFSFEGGAFGLLERLDTADFPSCDVCDEFTIEAFKFTFGTFHLCEFHFHHNDWKALVVRHDDDIRLTDRVAYIIAEGNPRTTQYFRLISVEVPKHPLHSLLILKASLLSRRADGLLKLGVLSPLSFLKSLYFTHS